MKRRVIYYKESKWRKEEGMTRHLFVCACIVSGVTAKDQGQVTPWMDAFLFNLGNQTKRIKKFYQKLPRKLGIHIISETISSILILCNQWCQFKKKWVLKKNKKKVSLEMVQRFRVARSQQVCIYCKEPPSSAMLQLLDFGNVRNPVPRSVMCNPLVGFLNPLAPQDTGLTRVNLDVKQGGSGIASSKHNYQSRVPHPRTHCFCLFETGFLYVALAVPELLL